MLGVANPFSSWTRRPASTPEQDNKLTPFCDELCQALLADARRPRHERRTTKALYAQTKLSGYACRYGRVTDFVRQWRQQQGQAVAARGVKTRSARTALMAMARAETPRWAEVVKRSGARME